MGLDMYLKAERCISGWEHSKDRGLYDKVVKMVGGKRLEELPSLDVTINVAYWRKANAIHKWFVDNVQRGVDECQYEAVSREQLQSLVDLCKKVKAKELEAQVALPTQSGFFFGGTAYDEWYEKDLDATITQIEDALQTYKDGWYFKYHSSW